MKAHLYLVGGARLGVPQVGQALLWLTLLDKDPAMGVGDKRSGRRQFEDLACGRKRAYACRYSGHDRGDCRLPRPERGYVVLDGSQDGLDFRQS